MTFLTPIPAMIAAALAVPALLFLYFLKLRRRPVRVSSTMLWDQATRDLQVNVPFRMIRPSWLLLLQLLILAAFLFALARPAIRSASPPPARLVLLIDRSASMSALDGAPESEAPVTRLAAAKALAQTLVADMVGAGSGAQACVVTFAARPAALTPFLTDRSALRAAIDAVEPTDQPADLKAALELVGALLSHDASDESTAPPRGLVVLFSDGSFPDGGPLALSGGEFRFRRVGRAPLAAAPEPAADGSPESSGPSDPRNNLGITAIAGRRDFDDPGVVRVFLRVQNAAAWPVATGLTLSLDDRVVERRAIEAPAAGPGDAGPAQTAVTFRLETRDAGVVRAVIDRPDLLDSDNSAAMVLAPAASPRVLLVVPDAPADTAPAPAIAPPPGQEWIIADVLREMNLRSVRTISASAYNASPDAHAADLAVFDRVRPERMPAIPTLSFGSGLPTPALSLAPAGDEPTYFLSWDRAHPAMRDVALDTVLVSRPRTIELRDAAGVRTTELALGRDGPLIAAVEERGVRHIVVGFALPDSTWPLHFGFPIFVAGAVDYLTLRADAQAAQWFSTTQPVAIHPPDAWRPAPVSLDGPLSVSLPAPGAGTATLDFGVLPLAGVYAVRGQGSAGVLPSAVAVNVAEAFESALAVRDSVRVGGRTVQSGPGGEGPREIWHWFVIAALALLVYEWFLSAWSSRA